MKKENSLKSEGNEYDGDVVAPAPFVGCVNELGDGFFDRGGCEDNGEYLVVRNLVGESIGAEQVDVAGVRSIKIDVWFDDGLGAERLCHDMFVGKMLDFFRRFEDALVDVILQKGVIARDLNEVVVSDSVGSGVAHIKEEGAFWREHECDECGAHASLCRVFGSSFKDAKIGGMVAHDEPVPGKGWKMALKDSQGRVRCPNADFVDCQRACDFARRWPPHAVGDDIDFCLFEDGKDILVNAARAPDVGLSVNHGRGLGNGWHGKYDGHKRHGCKPGNT